MSKSIPPSAGVANNQPHQQQQPLPQQQPPKKKPSPLPLPLPSSQDSDEDGQMFVGEEDDFNEQVSMGGGFGAGGGHHQPPLNQQPITSYAPMTVSRSTPYQQQPRTSAHGGAMRGTPSFSGTMTVPVNTFPTHARIPVTAIGGVVGDDDGADEDDDTMIGHGLNDGGSVSSGELANIPLDTEEAARELEIVQQTERRMREMSSAEIQSDDQQIRNEPNYRQLTHQVSEATRHLNEVDARDAELEADLESLQNQLCQISADMIEDQTNLEPKLLDLQTRQAKRKAFEKCEKQALLMLTEMENERAEMLKKRAELMAGLRVAKERQISLDQTKVQIQQLAIKKVSPNYEAEKAKEQEIYNERLKAKSIELEQKLQKIADLKSKFKPMEEECKRLDQKRKEVERKIALEKANESKKTALLKSRLNRLFRVTIPGVEASLASGCRTCHRQPGDPTGPTREDLNVRVNQLLKLLPPALYRENVAEYQEAERKREEDARAEASTAEAQRQREQELAEQQRHQQLRQQQQQAMKKTRTPPPQPPLQPQPHQVPVGVRTVGFDATGQGYSPLPYGESPTGSSGYQQQPYYPQQQFRPQYAPGQYQEMIRQSSGSPSLIRLSGGSGGSGGSRGSWSSLAGKQFVQPQPHQYPRPQYQQPYAPYPNQPVYSRPGVAPQPTVQMMPPGEMMVDESGDYDGGQLPQAEFTEQQPIDYDEPIEGEEQQYYEPQQQGGQK